MYLRLTNELWVYTLGGGASTNSLARSYDGLGRRVEVLETVGVDISSLTRYVYAGRRAVEELDARHLAIMGEDARVYATPMMILEMEMASGDAIRRFLQPGWITVGTEVDIKHLGASLVGATVRTTAKVIAVERRVIRFEVAAFEGEHTG